MKTEKPLSAAVDELLQQLKTTYTEACASLDKERTELEQESQHIQKAANDLRLRLPAKARKAARDADDLLLEGKDELAAIKYEEQRKAEAAPTEMEQRRSVIAERIKSLDAEKRKIARRVHAAWRSEFRKPLVEAQRALCDVLQHAWDAETSFARGTDTLSTQPPLLAANMRDDLTAREHGPEATTFLQLQNWFGGSAPNPWARGAA